MGSRAGHFVHHPGGTMQKAFRCTRHWAAILVLFSLAGCIGGNSSSPPPYSPNSDPGTQPAATQILSTSPASEEIDIALTTAVTVTFSRPLDCTSVIATSMTLTAPANVPVPGTVSCSGTAITFTPDVPLLRCRWYEAGISSWINDSAGRQIRTGTTWRFESTCAPSQQFEQSVFASYGYTFPSAVAIGDVNGDSRNDVVVTTDSYFSPANDYKLKVFLQDGQGGLATAVTYSLTANPIADDVAVGDINGDGKDEVILANRMDGVRVLVQDDSGGLVIGADYKNDGPDLIQLADMDRDGLLDVVALFKDGAIFPNDDKIGIFFQNGGGTLDPAVKYDVVYGDFSDLSVGDLNGDTRPDIAIMSGEGNTDLCILHQNADGSFGPAEYYYVEELGSRTGIAIGDVTGDSLDDLVYTFGGNSPNSFIDVLYQDGMHTIDQLFSYSSYECVAAPKIVDLNQDGRKDVVVVHEAWESMGYYLQAPDGSLEEEERYQLYDYPWGEFHSLAVGDINNDGRPDAVVLTEYGMEILYHK
jgi:hypothetical protein